MANKELLIEFVQQLRGIPKSEIKQAILTLEALPNKEMTSQKIYQFLDSYFSAHPNLLDQNDQLTAIYFNKLKLTEPPAHSRIGLRKGK